MEDLGRICVLKWWKYFTHMRKSSYIMSQAVSSWCNRQTNQHSTPVIVAASSHVGHPVTRYPHCSHPLPAETCETTVWRASVRAVSADLRAGTHWVKAARLSWTKPVSWLQLSWDTETLLVTVDTLGAVSGLNILCLQLQNFTSNHKLGPELTFTAELLNPGGMGASAIPRPLPNLILPNTASNSAKLNYAIFPGTKSWL